MYYMRPLVDMTIDRFNYMRSIGPMYDLPNEVPDQEVLDRYREYMNGKNIPVIIVEFRPILGYETQRINITTIGDMELAKIVDKYDFNAETVDKLSKLVDMMKEKKKSGD